MSQVYYESRPVKILEGSLGDYDINVRISRTIERRLTLLTVAPVETHGGDVVTVFVYTDAHRESYRLADSPVHYEDADEDEDEDEDEDCDSGEYHRLHSALANGYLDNDEDDLYFGSDEPLRRPE